MTALLGLTLQDAQLILAAQNSDKPVRVTTTSGYKPSEDMACHTDTRVIGVRETEPDILLIIANF